jgi:hypothetical protein
METVASASPSPFRAVRVRRRRRGTTLHEATKLFVTVMKASVQILSFTTTVVALAMSGRTHLCVARVRVTGPTNLPTLFFNVTTPPRTWWSSQAAQPAVLLQRASLSLILICNVQQQLPLGTSSSIVVFFHVPQ